MRKEAKQMKWTNDQQKAIDARDGTLLVSAAAGSGKTAVLVERVIRRICDSENPCGVENLLIVTFTNAAAAQMKEKISAAIGKMTALNPSDKRLRRQQLMLLCANICTIDSFCIGLVRENFHALGIAPDFVLLDEGRLSIMKMQAVNSVVEELHKNASESFLTLSELVSDSSGDQKLINAIKKLHQLSQAYPFPERWLRSLAEEFSNPLPAAESNWGKTIINYSECLLRNCKSDAENCIALLSREPELEAKYRPAFENDILLFEEKLQDLCNDDWDAIADSMTNLEFSRMSSAPKGYESAVKDACKITRDTYKAKAKKELGKLFSISESVHKRDIERLSPVINELINAVLKFGEEFSRLKSEENGADFSDTLHLALKLLIEPDGDVYKRTPLALGLAENYAEILVDEYQDVNQAQDMIFSALSKDESNLFFVGDVKQSIYGFRQAMPEIFLARRDSMKEYENGNYPARVTLGKNFRSRIGVTETVNFIFSQIMSKEAGGLEYDKDERLEAAADYPESSEPDTELCLIEAEKENYLSAQAKYAADYIEKAVSGGMTVSDGGEQRKARYGDFCLLLRSVKGNAFAFTSEFEKRGIPFSCEAGEAFLSSPEITFVLSLLKIIDNPVDDIPLTSVMLSPVFGFTPDDLAEMRADERNGSIYHCLVTAENNGSKKASAFLERIRQMRCVAATVSVGELVRRLIEETGMRAIVGAMKNSEKRLKNLNSFIDLAKKYETAGKRSVSGFIRYIGGISESGGKIEASSPANDGGNIVKIMTVHKSKGLEFPVCFLVGCEKNYNEMGLRDDLLISPESGIGIKTTENGAKYDTLPRLAAAMEIKKAARSEELRVLYVALTRPKEKLIITAASDNWNNKLCKLASLIRHGNKSDPFTVGGFTSYADCIVSALMKHPDAHSLRNAAGLSHGIALPCDTSLKVNIIRPDDEAGADASEKACESPDPEILSQIRERLGYVYPFEKLDGIVAKRIASKLDSEEIGGEFFASRRPAFVGKGGMTPAQRGTATHRFMQFSDYEAARRSVESELERLTQNGTLTEAEAAAVDRKSVKAFFDGSLASRILAAEKIYKEYSFTSSIPLREMNPEVPANEADGEVIIIEGVADCAFVENGELVIVDFKTDRANSAEELADRYREQLSVYRRCLSEVLGLPVKETLIYSFRLGESINI